MAPCGARRCPRAACVRVSVPGKGKGPVDQDLCLMHFYCCPGAVEIDVRLGGHGARLLDATAYNRQRVEASETVRDLVHDIDDDIERELAQARKIVRKRKRAQERLRKAAEAEATASAPATARGAAKAAAVIGAAKSVANPFARPDQRRQGDGNEAAKRTSLDMDKLYEWQLQREHSKQQSQSQSQSQSQQQQQQRQRLRDEEARQRRANDEKLRRRPGTSTSTAALLRPKEARSLKSAVGLPNEPWRAKSAELLAQALFVDEDAAWEEASRRALEIERKLFEATGAGATSDTPVAPGSSSSLDAAAAALAGAVGVEAPATSGGGGGGENANENEDEEAVGESVVDQLRRKASGARAADPKRAAYTRRVRGLLRALRVAENVKLRESVLRGQLSIDELLEAPDEALMEPSRAAKWRETRELLFKQSTVVSVADAASIATKVNDVVCPQCRNIKDNVLLTMASHHESSKAEIWGNKEDRNDSKERLRCSACNFTWVPGG